MVTFSSCIQECINNEEFMREYERLAGVKIRRKHPIHAMIDKATGYDKKILYDFFDFVRDYVFIPLVQVDHARKEYPKV